MDHISDHLDHVSPWPVGSRVLHIGPSKTGTTALQGACWTARTDMLAQGVLYAGNRRHATAPAKAVTGQPPLFSDSTSPAAIAWWRRLVREMQRASTPRAIYSSEFLAHADAAQAGTIARDIGDQGQVLITLRPLAAMLGSLWQQHVQAGSTRTRDEWLRRVLGDGPEVPDVPMWRMHRHGELARRWADAFGRERITLVVLDPADHDVLYRDVERLLDLRPGTLVPDRDLLNRSLTLPEVEAIRQLNLQAREAGVSRSARQWLVLGGAARAVKRRPPAADAPRVRLPVWANERAASLAQEAVESIASLGIRVVGPLETLLQIPSAAPEEPQDLRLDPATSAALALGMAYGTGLALGRDQVADPDLRPLGFLGARDISQVMAKRVRDGLRRRGRLASLGDD